MSKRQKQFASFCQRSRRKGRTMDGSIINMNRLEAYRENNRIEAKKALGGLPHSLWETYSAFANTLGGILLLGVEERKDGSFLVHDLPDPQHLIDEFWSIISDSERVSRNILKPEQVRIEELDGKRIITITVPRAERRERPIYIGTDIYTGSYRRDGEGDYHCSREEIEHMKREAEEDSGRQVLEELSIHQLDENTISRYRKRLSQQRPGHMWLELPKEDFLEKIGAVGQGKDGNRYPTTAGLLMFGKERDIVKKYPCYAVDYQELRTDGIWVDLVISGTGNWTGNLYDFFEIVSEKMIKGMKLPYKGIETPVHKAICEVLVNCLVNADYEAKQGVLVQKAGKQLVFENPGTFGVDQEQAVEGGISSPRNPELIQMFHLINIGKGDGKGLSRIYSLWREQGWAMPEIREEFKPERIQVSLVVEKEEQNTGGGKKLREERRKANEVIYESQKQQVIDCVTASIQISTAQTAELLDISKASAKEVLSKMVEEGILERRGDRRNRIYRLKA